MNVILTIEAPGLEAAINNLASALADRAAPDAQPADKVEAPGKPTRAPRAAKEEKTSSSTPPTSGETDTSATSDTASGKENAGSASGDDAAVDYADVKKAVVALATSKGRQAVVDLLDKFGVPEGGKADQVPEERWGELLAALKEAAE